MRVWVMAAVLVPMLTGCNLSIVQPEEALYRQTVGQGEPAPEAERAATVEEAAPKAFYLALPLSGPQYRHANVYGSGRVLPAGTRLVVDRIERGAVTGEIPPQWYDWYPQVVGSIRRVYRIYFHTQEATCADGCMAHWRAADDAAFERRFEGVFVTQDPLARLDEETRALVTQHKVAGWFDADTVRLSIGAPNAVVESGHARRWVYEARYCQGPLLIAEPELALEFDDADVQTFERLSARDFYYPLEPIDPNAGLCGARGALSPFLALGPNGSIRRESTPLEARFAADRPYHRITDRLLFGESYWLRRPGPAFGETYVPSSLAQ